jgi:hypothetical protein
MQLIFNYHNLLEDAYFIRKYQVNGNLRKFYSSFNSSEVNEKMSNSN